MGSSPPTSLTSGIEYTVTETTLPADFTLTDSNCTINGGAPIGTTFTTADSDVIVCTFENTFTPPPSGTFTVNVSKSTNADNSFLFTVTNNVSGSSSQISVPTEEGGGFGSGVFNMIIGNDFTITEDPLPGYTVTSSDCTIDGLSVGTDFIPADGDVVDCTFVNLFS